MADKSPGFFRRTLGGLWNLITWIRVTLLNVFFLVILIAVVAAIWPKDPLEVPNKTLLKVAPTGVLVDQYTHIDPFAKVIDSQDSEPAETRVKDLIEAITFAAEDDRIEGLVLELDSLVGGGISKLEEIGDALTVFKESGKPIYAQGSNLTQQQYYLASYADEVNLNPLGSVLITGFSTYRNYYKDAIDNLKISMHVFRTGDYKDAMEPFIRNSMSDASREHNQCWLNQLWSVYTGQIEQLRDLPEGSINDYIATMDAKLKELNGNAAKLALDAGLVDSLVAPKQWRSELGDTYGANNDGSYKSFDYLDYLSIERSLEFPEPDTIALIVARGTIKSGYQPAGQIGDKSFLELLDQVKQDPTVKALVVRIDSGGGGVYASENIRQGLMEIREKGIPIVVSMGTVAASGGYWIATPADEIWATPTTITGSIGVFGAFVTLEDSLKHLGINTDGIGTSELAGAIRADRALSPMAQSLLQQGINHMYQQFIELVAQARDTTPEAIDQIAQGRVWSGQSALELGLVDELGNLEQAIASAAELAEIETYTVETIEQELSPFEQFVSQVSQSHVAGLIQSSLESQQVGLPPALIQHYKALAEPLNFAQSLTDPRGVYALCFECVQPQ
ncbi:signal peptide peptidase SppA [Sessilibacter corallicola]|uniref:Signal peptide peptidase SppA n=1 Tax=Sessilibacter corallicola TaxID=2904075 RepID=A0ABQ0A4U6_9GAMM